MQLLGTYNSNLASFQYQQLLALLQAALAAGDLSSGSAFDKTTLLQLEANATSFSSLPLATAGTRALDESLLQPLALLDARFASLLAEANNFVTRSTALLAFLSAETDLLDKLLAADGLNNWTAGLPALPASWSFAWDFSTGQGKTAVQLTSIDPANGVVYDSELRTGSIFNATTGLTNSGLLPPANIVELPVKNMEWTYPDAMNASPLYGPDMTWAELSLVYPLPQVDFSTQPTVQVILPLIDANPNFISVSGTAPGGALPTYLRLLFYPRTVQVVGSVSNGQIFTVSQYTIDPDSVSVFTTDSEGNPLSFWNNGTDYTVDPDGSITPVSMGNNVAVTIRFNENYPAYQCSVDQETWSDIHMLDAQRPYRDDETSFLPLGIVNGAFPLTDETGLPTGLYFTLTSILPTDYTLLISTPGASSYGATAQLEIDFAQPKFCTGLRLSPYTAFAAEIVQIDIQGLTSVSRQTVFQGSKLMDQATEITFPRQIITSVFVYLRQANYTLIEYQDLSTDSLRRSTMASVEASLPFSLGQYVPPVSTTVRGYEYTLGFENIEGVDVAPELPGVLVQGPQTIQGCPILFRLDAQTSGTVSLYLCYQALNAAGVLVDSNLSGIPVTPGTSFVMPYTAGTNLANIASAQVYLRAVLRTPDSVLSRYQLQATLR